MTEKLKALFEKIEKASNSGVNGVFVSELKELANEAKTEAESEVEEN